MRNKCAAQINCHLIKPTKNKKCLTPAPLFGITLSLNPHRVIERGKAGAQMPGKRDGLVVKIISVEKQNVSNETTENVLPTSTKVKLSKPKLLLLYL